MGDLILIQHRYNCVWNMKGISPNFENMKDHLLFMSWQVMKQLRLNSVKKSKVFQEILDTMNNARANQSKIGETSMKALKLMYGVQIMLQ